MTDTCDRCAARDRAMLERAALLLEDEAATYDEIPVQGNEPTILRHSAELVRALADTPAPCDCAARDRVVEAAVRLARLGADATDTECDEAVANVDRAVAALEGAEHE